MKSSVYSLAIVFSLALATGHSDEPEMPPAVDDMPPLIQLAVPKPAPGDSTQPPAQGPISLDDALLNPPKSEPATRKALNLTGRRFEEREKLLKEHGGTAASEAAVELALAWLAAHQLPDGGWSFNHQLCPRCQGQCDHKGDAISARNAATGLALLPFVGAGHTHKVGKYKNVVKAGLYFLVSRMRSNGSFHEPKGTMYSHGICALVLCEAYALTADKHLQRPAQTAIEFIGYAQDPVGGGWRYQPKQPGDMSIASWQLQALNTAHAAYLDVPEEVLKKASRFLDSVQYDDGSKYGYVTQKGTPATTAAGLLSRIHLGWEQDNAALKRGVEYLAKLGPDIAPNQGDMYFNFYATQVMRQRGGDSWKAWNTKMRDGLIQTQSKEGHEKGSWYLANGKISEEGGRLYATAMAALILEVYYRHSE